MTPNLHLIQKAPEIVAMLRNAGWRNPGITDSCSLEPDAADLIEALLYEIGDLTARNDENLGASRMWSRRYHALLRERETMEKDVAEFAKHADYACNYCKKRKQCNIDCMEKDNWGCSGWAWRGISAESDELSAEELLRLCQRGGPIYL